jgi:endonuclease YncB( thermonuclease family)
MVNVSTQNPMLTKLPLIQLVALVFALTAFSAFAGKAGADQLLVGVSSVIDGDTIEIHGERIRFLDMDAPESRQTCEDAGGINYRCGQKAALALSDWLGSSTVTCNWSKRDRYGRVLARCLSQGNDVGLWMVERGWAVPYRNCKCETYRDAAAKAKEHKLGVWSGAFIEPWVWRHNH